MPKELSLCEDAPMRKFATSNTKTAGEKRDAAGVQELVASAVRATLPWHCKQHLSKRRCNAGCMWRQRLVSVTHVAKGQMYPSLDRP